MKADSEQLSLFPLTHQVQSRQRKCLPGETRLRNWWGPSIYGKNGQHPFNSVTVPKIGHPRNNQEAPKKWVFSRSVFRMLPMGRECPGFQEKAKGERHEPFVNRSRAGLCSCQGPGNISRIPRKRAAGILSSILPKPPTYPALHPQKKPHSRMFRGDDLFIAAKRSKQYGKLQKKCSLLQEATSQQLGHRGPLSFSPRHPLQPPCST